MDWVNFAEAVWTAMGGAGVGSMESSYGIQSRKAIDKNGPLTNFFTFMPCTQIGLTSGVGKGFEID